MFYKTGVDITNDKQMFNFLKNHFEYYTMSSWNRCYSIANNVKVYNLGLTGNCWTALSLLENGEYDTISCMIADWRIKYPMYQVFFNGRSGGYLVLSETDSVQHVLPESILDSDNYDEYKDYCKEYYGSVKANRSELVFYTKLVQDFDKLCDEIRDYCDELSNLKFEVIEMEKAVEDFNSKYEDDLFFLDFKPLSCDIEGKVDVSEISTMLSLWEAFAKTADRYKIGYTLMTDDDGFVYYKQDF